MNTVRKLINEDIDAVLKFLPVFQAQGFKFGTWDSPKEVENVIQLGMFYLSEEGAAFVHTLYDSGWVIPFDWPKWQDCARKYVESRQALGTADIEILRRLLTTHVRKDRFCEGHLAQMFESGHLTAILLRLQQIREVAP